MKEIDRLAKMLKKAGIPFEHNDDNVLGIKRIAYPTANNKKRVCSAIQGYGTYGNRENLIEIMGLTDTKKGVQGFLTSKDVFERIKKHWESTRTEQ